MCGFFLAHGYQESLNDFSLAFSLIDSRGPDKKIIGENKEGNFFFGQNILAINSLPQSYEMKMLFSKSKRFQLLYNGEIYNIDKNYFRKQTEFEYLLDKIDEEGVERALLGLEGMFAVVIYDVKEERFFLYSDLATEKNIFYYRDNDSIVISSEILPIIKLKPQIKINKTIISDYLLSRHFMMEEQTCFKGILKAKGGSLISIDKKTKTIHEKPLQSFRNNINEDEFRKFDNLKKADVLDLLKKSLNEELKKLTQSPLPYHCAFSGGIDSSLVTKLLSDSKEEVTAHSLLFEDKDQVVHNTFGLMDNSKVNHRPYEVSVDQFHDLLKKSISRFASPLPTHSSVSQAILAREVKNMGGKILLGGDGADELFGGYVAYGDIINDNSSAYDFNPSPYSGVSKDETFYKLYNHDTYLEKKREEWNHALTCYEFIKCKKERSLKAMLYLDYTKLFTSVGLYSADVASMLYSVESRSLFASKGIREIGFNLPIKYLFSHEGSKIQFKHILSSILCLELPSYKIPLKQGFSGFPNECAQKLLGENTKHRFNRASDFFHTYFNEWNDFNRAAEWKLQNVELFLREFESYV